MKSYMVVSKTGEYLVPTLEDARETFKARNGQQILVVRVAGIQGEWRYRGGGQSAWDEWPRSTARRGWIYAYALESTREAYIGKDSNDGARLHEHERGRYPTTAALNQKAAQLGEMPKSIRWEVDTTQHTLDYWEKHFADVWRAKGWQLINKTTLTLRDMDLSNVDATK